MGDASLVTIILECVLTLIKVLMTLEGIWWLSVIIIAIRLSSARPAQIGLLCLSINWVIPFPRWVNDFAPAFMTFLMSLSFASWCPIETVIPFLTAWAVSLSAPGFSAARVRSLILPLDHSIMLSRSPVSGIFIHSGLWTPRTPISGEIKGPSRWNPGISPDKSLESITSAINLRLRL